MKINGYTIETGGFFHRNVDLRGTDLRLPDLSGFDHRNVDLSGTIFEGVRL